MTIPTKPKIGIVGKGAIGGLLAFKCATLQLNYQLLLRTKQDLCLEVQDITGQQHTITPVVCDINQSANFDLLILPVKAYQVIPILSQMKSFIRPHHIIMLLHNGMGTIEQASSICPNNPLIAATTSYGAFKPVDNKLIETGLGETHLGWIKKPNTELLQTITLLLSSLLPPSTWHTDITSALWKKLAINAVINPLTAINNIKNGQLVDNKYQSIIFQLCSELSEVLLAIGYKFEVEQLVKNAMQVIEATANNYSSMHQDIHNQRITEIEFISGYVAKKAESLNIATPINNQLFEQVKALQTFSSN
jgi:2-dehydropantoate 2-reductase